MLKSVSVRAASSVARGVGLIGIWHVETCQQLTMDMLLKSMKMAMHGATLIVIAWDKHESLGKSVQMPGKVD